MNSVARKWMGWAFFNLVLVALAGLLLRTKILFPLPWLHHKNLLHAHSHFAFAGWISLFLMSALVSLLPAERAGRYNRILTAYCITAYGMLFSFPFQGYGPVSIFFSTVSVLASWWFGYELWREKSLAASGKLVGRMSRWSVFYLILSSLGTFFLAWLMANHINKAELYFGSIYFYLHFQYNGWFLFAILTLLLARLKPSAQEGLGSSLQALAWICLPAYFLSALWMRLPLWMFVLAVIAALLQPLVVINLFRKGYRELVDSLRSPAQRQLWGLSIIAFLIKIVLQSLSVIPGLSSYAFAYRPVVIGYLHLVLLGFVTLFLFGWMLEKGILRAVNGHLSAWCRLFIVGILLTEFTLMAQGISAMFYVAIPLTNELLFGAAICLFGGILGMNLESRYLTQVIRPMRMQG
ncbi:MAG TPA: hypothetical protein VIK80_10030 [Flavihumibacter sp.]|jgi:hypothetical protein